MADLADLTGSASGDHARRLPPSGAGLRIRRLRLAVVTATRSGADAGLTLAELAVSMIIVSVILAVGGAMMISTVRERSVSDAHTASQADARQIVEMLTRDLGVAVPPPSGASKSAVAFAGARKITFYTLTGSTSQVISMVTYEVDATSQCLRRTIIPQSGNTFPASSAITQCVAPGPVNTGGEDIFSYYNVRTSASVTPTEIVPPAAGYSVPTNEATVKYIGGVEVTLWVRAEDAPTVTPTVVDQWITLANQSNAILSGRV